MYYDIGLPQDMKPTTTHRGNKCRCIKKFRCKFFNHTINEDEILEYGYGYLHDDFNQPIHYIIYFGFSGNTIVSEKVFNRHFTDIWNDLTPIEFLQSVFEDWKNILSK